MENNITSADIVLSGYNSFEDLSKDMLEASKSIPSGFVGISGSIIVEYKEEDEYPYNIRSLININTSTIEEAIKELQKLSTGNYTRVTLDVSLEKSCNGPKECHTCIYSKETL